MTSTPVLMLKFARVLGLVGADVVMAKLDEIEQTSPNNNAKTIENYIISTVCTRYNTTPKAIRKPRVDGDELLARNLCFVLLEKHMDGYSHERIGRILDKTSLPVSNALKQFSQMGTRVKHEREFIEAYNELNPKVRAFKNSIDQ